MKEKDDGGFIWRLVNSRFLTNLFLLFILMGVSQMYKVLKVILTQVM
jgi:hypothetical protein